MSDEIKVLREVAEEEFERFAEFARLKMDSYRSEANNEKIETYRQHFIEAVVDGRIEVDAEGSVTVKTECESVDKVHFGRRPTQGDRKAMDYVKMMPNTLPMEARTIAHLASVTGIAPAKFNKLEEHDIKLVKEVFELFLDE